MNAAQYLLEHEQEELNAEIDRMKAAAEPLNDDDLVDAEITSSELHGPAQIVRMIDMLQPTDAEVVTAAVGAVMALGLSEGHAIERLAAIQEWDVGATA